MRRALTFAATLALGLGLLPAGVGAGGPAFAPGAAGAGDPYFPEDGNGGYDVQRYDLVLTYDPASGLLSGTASIAAVATQDLSRFNLDFDGMTVRSISIGGQAARWTRVGGELRVTPRAGIPDGARYTTVVAYDGVPALQPEADGSQDGFNRTDDGALVAGEPHGASGWFPANDHPSDKAAFHYRIRVPAGLQAIANGALVGSSTAGGWTTWTWDAPEPMATYLATMNVGHFDISRYTRAGLDYLDAFDPSLFAPSPPFVPRTGGGFAVAQPGDGAYKRLATTIAVPAAGATLAFWVDRHTEDWWDYLAVEAHHPGLDDWTTLPDGNGHTTQDGGGLCRYSDAHPFLAHYMTRLVPADPSQEPGCDPTGTTGTWNAASGTSDGYEPWSIDLTPYAGTQVEVSISYITDEYYALAGLFVDDVMVSTGQGSTGFEKKLSPWSAPGAPAGSPGNTTDWIQASSFVVPNAAGTSITASFAYQADIIRFHAGLYGPYPFGAAGGIVDDYENIGFALETQTRPVYSRWFFGSPTGDDWVLAHELAHQWFGDSVALARWKDIWLNEGFATYAEWLWGETRGWGTAQDNYDWWTTQVPPDDGFWGLAIGDPGPVRLFDFAVYARGALTLHALRQLVGDATFFGILRTWATQHAGGNATTEQFIALAEQRSGMDLDGFFQAWLYTAAYPLAGSGARASSGVLRLADMPAATRSEYLRYGRRSSLDVR